MKIFFVIVAVLLFIVGNYFMNYTYNMMDAGMILIIASIFGVIAFVLTPVDAEAKGQYVMPGAGITRQMNVYLAMAFDYEELNTTEDEIDLLARLITAEIGYSNKYNADEYERALYLCGSVVLNRMKSDKYPDTLREVIYQPHQYSCTTDGHILRDYDEIAWEVAEGLLQYGTDVEKNVIYQSQFQQGSGVYEKIGTTYFCYE